VSLGPSPRSAEPGSAADINRRRPMANPILVVSGS
jgi:hypothetical protein